MKLLNVKNMIPDIYTQESRDFQLFCNIYSYVVNGVKWDSDSAGRVIDSSTCKTEFLTLLQTKLGFFTKADFTFEDLRYALMAFKDLINNKGSLRAICGAVNVFLKTLGIHNKVRISLVTDDFPFGAYKIHDHTIMIGIESGITDTTLLDELFRYLVPAGYEYFIYFYVSIDPITEMQYHEHVTVLLVSDKVASLVRGPGNGTDLYDRANGTRDLDNGNNWLNPDIYYRHIPIEIDDTDYWWGNIKPQASTTFGDHYSLTSMYNGYGILMHDSIVGNPPLYKTKLSPGTYTSVFRRINGEYHNDDINVMDAEPGLLLTLRNDDDTGEYEGSVEGFITSAEPKVIPTNNSSSLFIDQEAINPQSLVTTGTGDSVHGLTWHGYQLKTDDTLITATSGRQTFALMGASQSVTDEELHSEFEHYTLPIPPEGVPSTGYRYKYECACNDTYQSSRRKIAGNQNYVFTGCPNGGGPNTYFMDVKAYKPFQKEFVRMYYQSGAYQPSREYGDGKTLTWKGVTWTVQDDGSVVATRTTIGYYTGYSAYTVAYVDSSRSYSLPAGDYVLKGSNSGKGYIDLIIPDLLTHTNFVVKQEEIDEEVKFTIPSSLFHTGIQLQLHVDLNKIPNLGDSAIFTPSITQCEFIEPENVDEDGTVVGVNLLTKDYIMEQDTVVNGVKFHINVDKSITLTRLEDTTEGTTTVPFYISKFPQNQYSIHGCDYTIDGVLTVEYHDDTYDEWYACGSDSGAGGSFSVYQGRENAQYRFSMVLYGNTLDVGESVTIYPMVEVGYNMHKYLQPYGSPNSYHEYKDYGDGVSVYFDDIPEAYLDCRLVYYAYYNSSGQPLNTNAVNLQYIPRVNMHLITSLNYVFNTPSGEFSDGFGVHETETMLDEKTFTIDSPAWLYAYVIPPNCEYKLSYPHQYQIDLTYNNIETIMIEDNGVSQNLDKGDVLYGQIKYQGDQTVVPNNLAQCIANMYQDGLTIQTYDYQYFIANGTTTRDSTITLCNYNYGSQGELVSNHKFFIRTKLENASEIAYTLTAGTGGYTTVVQTYTEPINGIYEIGPDVHSSYVSATIVINSGQTLTNFTLKPIIVDLTAMFGPGNEPSVEDCNLIFDDYGPFIPPVMGDDYVSYPYTSLVDTDNVVIGCARYYNADGTKTLIVYPYMYSTDLSEFVYMDKTFLPQGMYTIITGSTSYSYDGFDDDFILTMEEYDHADDDAPRNTTDWTSGKEFIINIDTPCYVTLKSTIYESFWVSRGSGSMGYRVIIKPLPQLTYNYSNNDIQVDFIRDKSLIRYMVKNPYTHQLKFNYFEPTIGVGQYVDSQDYVTYSGDDPSNVRVTYLGNNEYHVQGTVSRDSNSLPTGATQWFPCTTDKLPANSLYYFYNGDMSERWRTQMGYEHFNSTLYNNMCIDQYLDKATPIEYFEPWASTSKIYLSYGASMNWAQIFNPEWLVQEEQREGGCTYTPLTEQHGFKIGTGFGFTPTDIKISTEDINWVAGHKYYVNYEGTSSTYLYDGYEDDGIDGIICPTEAIANDSHALYFRVNTTGLTGLIVPTLIDLTAIFGVGYEPSVQECRLYLSRFPKNYDTGRIIHSIITKMEVYDTTNNNEVVFTQNIPQEIMDTEGYGWGCSSGTANAIWYDSKSSPTASPETYMNKGTDRVEVSSNIEEFGTTDDGIPYVKVMVSDNMENRYAMTDLPYGYAYSEDDISTVDCVIRCDTPYVYIYNSTFEDIDDAKEKLDGCYLYYMLNTVERVPINTTQALEVFVDEDYYNERAVIEEQYAAALINPKARATVTPPPKFYRASDTGVGGCVGTLRKGCMFFPYYDFRRNLLRPPYTENQITKGYIRFERFDGDIYIYRSGGTPTVTQTMSITPLITNSNCFKLTPGRYCIGGVPNTLSGSGVTLKVYHMSSNVRSLWFTVDPGQLQNFTINGEPGTFLRLEIQVECTATNVPQKANKWTISPFIYGPNELDFVLKPKFEYIGDVYQSEISPYGPKRSPIASSTDYFVTKLSVNNNVLVGRHTMGFHCCFEVHSIDDKETIAEEWTTPYTLTELDAFADKLDGPCSIMAGVEFAKDLHGVEIYISTYCDAYEYQALSDGGTYPLSLIPKLTLSEDSPIGELTITPGLKYYLSVKVLPGYVFNKQQVRFYYSISNRLKSTQNNALNVTMGGFKDIREIDKRQSYMRVISNDLIQALGLTLDDLTPEDIIAVNNRGFVGAENRVLGAVDTIQIIGDDSVYETDPDYVFKGRNSLDITYNGNTVTIGDTTYNYRGLTYSLADVLNPKDKDVTGLVVGKKYYVYTGSAFVEYPFTGEFSSKRVMEFPTPNAITYFKSDEKYELRQNDTWVNLNLLGFVKDITNSGFTNVSINDLVVTDNVLYYKYNGTNNTWVQVNYPIYVWHNLEVIK